MDVDKLDNFKDAFATSSGGCRRKCRCGREFYNSDGGWDWEPGELDSLQKSGATDLDYTVRTIIVDAEEYVMDCDCWMPIAEKVIKWIDSHAHSIAEYLTLEKRRKLKEANKSPVVVCDELV